MGVKEFSGIQAVPSLVKQAIKYNFKFNYSYKTSQLKNI